MLSSDTLQLNNTRIIKAAQGQPCPYGDRGRKQLGTRLAQGGSRHTYVFECVKHICFYLDTRNPWCPWFDLKISKA